MCKLAEPSTTVFDVGANIGLMAIPVLRSCGTCRVVSFEPSPNSLPYLEETARGSAFAGRWIVRGVALAASAGELDFTIGRPGDALFEGFNSGDRIANARVIKVKVSTVDEEWRALARPRVSVIKIDVEGAEGGVLDGASELHSSSVRVGIEPESRRRQFGLKPDSQSFVRGRDYESGRFASRYFGGESRSGKNGNLGWKQRRRFFLEDLRHPH